MSMPLDSRPLRTILNSDADFVATLSDDQVHDFGDLCWIEDYCITGEVRDMYFTLPLPMRINALKSLQERRDNVILYGAAH